MRTIFGIILLTGSFFVPLPTAAQATPATVSPQSVSTSGKPEEQIEALEKKLAGLIVSANWTEYAKHVGSDFTHIDSNGNLETREEWLKNYKNGPRKVVVMEPENLMVRTYGDTAILQGERTASVREAGRVSSNKVRFTEVFVERDGEWYMAAEQETMEKKH